MTPSDRSEFLLGIPIILRLSQKHNIKIKAGPLTTLPLDADPFADWTAHLFVADRTQYNLAAGTSA